MNKIEISHKGRSVKFALPSCWEELTGKQVRQVCRIVCKGVDAPNFRLMLCFALMPSRARRVLRRALRRLYGDRAAARWVRKAHRRARVRARVEEALADLQSQLVVLSETLSFVQTSGVLAVNPVPVVRAGLRRLYGAQPDLSGCTYEEFAGASHYLRTFADLQAKEAGSREALGALCRGLACLWLPKARSAEARQRAMEDDAVARRAKLIERLKPAVIDAMFLLAQSAMKTVVERFPTVFSGDGDGDGNESWGHAEVVMSLAGDKFGNVEETARRKLYAILRYIEWKIANCDKNKDVGL
jgi:hypothetical protein